MATRSGLAVCKTTDLIRQESLAGIGMQSITMLAAHAGWYPDELAEGLEVERYCSQTARRAETQKRGARLAR